MVLLLVSATLPAFSARLFVDGVAGSVMVYEKDGYKVHDDRVSQGINESWLVHAVTPARLVSDNLNFRISMTAGSSVALSRFSSNELALYVLEGTVRVRTSNNPTVSVTVFTPVSLFSAEAPVEFMVASTDNEEWIYTFIGEVTAFNSITGVLSDLNDMTFLDMIPGPEEKYGAEPIQVHIGSDVPPVAPETPEAVVSTGSPLPPEFSSSVQVEPLPVSAAPDFSSDVRIEELAPGAPEISDGIKVDVIEAVPPAAPSFASTLGVEFLEVKASVAPAELEVKTPGAPEFSEQISVEILPLLPESATEPPQAVRVAPPVPDFSTTPMVTLLTPAAPEFSSVTSSDVLPDKPPVPEFAPTEPEDVVSRRPPTPQFEATQPSDVVANRPPLPEFSDDSAAVLNQPPQEPVSLTAEEQSRPVATQPSAASILSGTAPEASLIWGVDTVLTGFYQLQNGPSGMNLSLKPYINANGFELGLRADVSLTFGSPLSWSGNVLDFDTASTVSTVTSLLRFIDRINYGSRYNGFFINADDSSFQVRDRSTLMNSYNPKFNPGRALPLRQAFNSDFMSQELYIDNLYGTALVDGGFQASMLRLAVKPSSSLAIGLSSVIGLRLNGTTVSDMLLFPALDAVLTLRDTRELTLGVSLTAGTFVDALNPSFSTIYTASGATLADRLPNALLSVQLDARIADSVRASLFAAYNHGEVSTDRFNSTTFSGTSLTAAGDTLVIGGDILVSLGSFSLSADYALPFTVPGFSIATLNPALPAVDPLRKADRGSLGLSINLKPWTVGIGMSHIGIIDAWSDLFSSGFNVEGFLNPVYSAWYAEAGYDNGTFGIKARAGVLQDHTAALGISPLLTLSGVFHLDNK